MKIWSVARHFVIFLLLVVSACRVADDDPNLDDPLRPSEVIEFGDRLEGKKIIVRGYLSSWSNLYLFDNKEISELPSSEVLLNEAVQVMDNSPDQRIASEYLTRKIRCTNSYAEIIGILDWSQSHRGYVIGDLHSIRIYDSSSFLGEGEICYEKGPEAIEFYNPGED